MSKESLEEKIKLTIFWLGLFCLTYLILGFIIKSDFTKTFDTLIFYEVLRDSLTLTAYFLAPVAAFILFTDWREQHKTLKSDKFYDEIEMDFRYSHFLADEMYLNMFCRSIKDSFEQKLEDDFQFFSTKLNNIIIKTKTFNEFQGRDGQEFLDKVSVLVGLFKDLKLQMIFVKSDVIALRGHSISDENRYIKSIFINDNVEALKNQIGKIKVEIELLKELKPKI